MPCGWGLGIPFDLRGALPGTILGGDNTHVVDDARCNPSQ